MKPPIPAASTDATPAYPNWALTRSNALDPLKVALTINVMIGHLPCAGSVLNALLTECQLLPQDVARVGDMNDVTNAPPTRGGRGAGPSALAGVLREAGLGVSRSTVHYWRKKGLIPPPPYDVRALVGVREWFAARCAAGRTAGSGARRRRKRARELLRAVKAGNTMPQS